MSWTVLRTLSTPLLKNCSGRSTERFPASEQSHPSENPAELALCSALGGIRNPHWTGLETVQWRRGGYDMVALSGVYTGNDARTRIVLKELSDKVTDVAAMRAFRFCVSVEHARYMAQRFGEAGIPARAVSAETSAADRRDASRAAQPRDQHPLRGRPL